MRARKGQVAIYLVIVLVALTFLMLMNVGAYLAVTAKNRAMNAGDSASLAAAACQGRLLARIGELNLEHLKLLGKGGEPGVSVPIRITEIAVEQSRLTFLGPLEGIRLANDAAKKVGAKPCSGMQEILRSHVNDVRTIYAQAPELYPEPWEDAWEEYATALELAIADGIVAGPDNIDFRNAKGGHYLLNSSFYSAVNGRSWCWFRFYAPGLLDNYTSYQDWSPLPLPDEEESLRQCANCEVFSLHLVSKVGSAMDLLGKELIMRLTGWTAEEMKHMPGLDNREQVWYFFADDRWCKWWEIDPDGEWKFPVVGKVKPEYDVKGCAAICRVYENIPKLVSGSGEREIEWSAAAKPFATAVDAGGKVVPITDCNGLVVPADWDVRLVPVDTVGGKDLSTANYGWMKHVKEHLPVYMVNGPVSGSGCSYCETLVAWERESLRREGREWLKTKSDSCIRCEGGGTVMRGGTPHGH